ncbi:MAG: hypothetical protein RL087_616, partial [Pseudomonadota bacterium]
IKNVVRALEQNGAMDYTIVVAASASESAAMQYVSAYSGCTTFLIDDAFWPMAT